MSKSIADIRLDYKLESLMEADVADDPIIQFGRWWDEAVSSKIVEVNAMTLATSTKEGIPSARVVLLKGFTAEGFIFYTNYQSHKGSEIEQNPNVALVFFWKELERQVRIKGIAEKVSGEESDNYFTSRPEGSKIGAWASPQSQTIETREWLETNYLIYADQFEKQEIQRPAHWGGYIVKPQAIEFWQGRSSRLHDRIQYTKQQDNWRIDRLAP